MIGRTTELQGLADLLRHPNVRLLTVLGPVGVGKSRLVREALATVDDVCSGGIQILDCDYATELHAIEGRLDELATAVARSPCAGQPEQGGILVCDNVVPSRELGSKLLQLLLAHPTLRFVLTSRAPLYVRPEQRYVVKPLAVPEEDAPFPGSVENSYPAVDLLVDRARAIDPSFHPSVESWPALAEICRRLDGLPLLIEIVAGWLPIIGLEHLRLLLRDRGILSLDLLANGPTDLPDRQRSVGELLRSNYPSLSPAEQQVLFRTSAFEHSFALDACTPALGAHDRGSAVTVVRSLVDRGWLVPIESSAFDSPRFRLLHVARDYVLGQEQKTGADRMAARAVADYCLQRFRLIDPAVPDERWQRLRAGLQQESKNVEAALSWALETGEAELALELLAAIWRLWLFDGSLERLRGWADRVLAGAKHITPNPALAQVCFAAGMVAHYQGASNIARRQLEKSVEVARSSDDPVTEAAGVTSLGYLALVEGDPSALVLLERGLALRSSIGDRVAVCSTLATLAVAALNNGERARAERAADAAWAICQELRGGASAAFGHWRLGHFYVYMGRLAYQQRDFARARANIEQGIRLLQSIGSQPYLAIALHLLGQALEGEGLREEAQVCYRESLALSCRHNLRWTAALAHQSLVALSGEHAELDEVPSRFEVALAAQDHSPRFQERSSVIAEPSGSRLQSRPTLYPVPEDWTAGRPIQLLRADHSLVEVQIANERTSDAPVEAAYEIASRRSHAGRSQLDTDWHPPEARGAGEDRIGPIGSADRVPSDPIAVLTAQEEAVLRLLAAGRSNPEIAEALTISRNTVMTHVRHIFRKLGVTNRVEAAAIAIAHGLVARASCRPAAL